MPEKGDFHFRVGDIPAAEKLVRQFHYSHRFPANVQVCGTWHEPGGLFGDYGDVVAACVFSIPPTRWREPVLELSRLVRRDDATVFLSGLISQTTKFIKSRSLIDLLISFADNTQGHHGGIYQACSWRFAGTRKRNMDGIIWRGEFVPGRSANKRWGTQSPNRLRGMGIDCYPHYDEGKHLYWMALNKHGNKKAKRIGLESLPYIKPQRITNDHTLS